MDVKKKRERHYYLQLKIYWLKYNLDIKMMQ